MFKTFKTIKISSAALLIVAASSTVASAQLGSLSGSVNAAVPAQIGVNAAVPSPTVRARTSTRARLGTYSRGHSHSGTHYHGRFAHDHGHFGYDHFHSDPHSHSHGYASLSVEIDARSKDAPQDITPLLFYGTKVESKKGKYLGKITSLSKTETGVITAVMVDGVPGLIPVDTLSADGTILVTSLKKKQLKG